MAIRAIILAAAPWQINPRNPKLKYGYFKVIDIPPKPKCLLHYNGVVLLRNQVYLLDLLGVKDIKIIVFENNYIPSPAGTTYEATIIYLIRQKGKLEIHSDRHIIGLFKLENWLAILKEFDFEVKQIRMEHSYDRFILGEGKYPLIIFACTKPLR